VASKAPPDQFGPIIDAFLEAANEADGFKMLDFRQKILVEKAARDAGFEIPMASANTVALFRSSLVPGELTISVVNAGYRLRVQNKSRRIGVSANSSVLRTSAKNLNAALLDCLQENSLRCCCTDRDLIDRASGQREPLIDLKRPHECIETGEPTLTA
jgi:hypothetical protein